MKYPNDWEHMDNLAIEGNKIDIGFVPKNIEKYSTCKNYASDATIKDSQYWAKVLYCMISLRIENNESGLGIKDYLKKVYYSKENPDSNEAINSLQIDNAKWFEIAKSTKYMFRYDSGMGGPNLEPSVSVEQAEQAILNNKKYVVFIDNGVTDELNLNTSTFNQILSTFKFIEK